MGEMPRLSVRVQGLLFSGGRAPPKELGSLEATASKYCFTPF